MKHLEDRAGRAVTAIYDALNAAAIYPVVLAALQDAYRAGLVRGAEIADDWASPEVFRHNMREAIRIGTDAGAGHTIGQRSTAREIAAAIRSEAADAATPRP